jgi:UDP-glucose 4-epimerase
LGKKINNHHIQFIQGDILDSRKIHQVLKEVDVVYHLAAKVSTPFSNIDSHFFEQVNHWGTAELIYAIEQSPVKKLIFMSSAAVYGISSELVDEETLPNPNSHYAISKLRAEEHVRRLFNKPIETIILRGGNVYGYSKSMRFDAVINKFMFEANFTNRLSINGNGRQYRTFIHIDKVIHILSHLLESEVPSGIYNLSDKNLEILEVVDVLKTIYPDIEFLFTNQHLQMNEIRVKPESKLYSYIPLPKSELLDELKVFKENLSFKSV